MHRKGWHRPAAEGLPTGDLSTSSSGLSEFFEVFGQTPWFWLLEETLQDEPKARIEVAW